MPCPFGIDLQKASCVNLFKCKYFADPNFSFLETHSDRKSYKIGDLVVEHIKPLVASRRDREEMYNYYKSSKKGLLPEPPNNNWKKVSSDELIKTYNVTPDDIILLAYQRVNDSLSYDVFEKTIPHRLLDVFESLAAHWLSLYLPLKRHKLYLPNEIDRTEVLIDSLVRSSESFGEIALERTVYGRKYLSITNRQTNKPFYDLIQKIDRMNKPINPTNKNITSGGREI